MWGELTKEIRPSKGYMYIFAEVLYTQSRTRRKGKVEDSLVQKFVVRAKKKGGLEKKVKSSFLAQ